MLVIDRNLVCKARETFGTRLHMPSQRLYPLQSWISKCRGALNIYLKSASLAILPSHAFICPYTSSHLYLTPAPHRFCSPPWETDNYSIHRFCSPPWEPDNYSIHRESTSLSDNSIHRESRYHTSLALATLGFLWRRSIQFLAASLLFEMFCPLVFLLCPGLRLIRIHSF